MTRFALSCLGALTCSLALANAASAQVTLNPTSDRAGHVFLEPPFPPYEFWDVTYLGDENSTGDYFGLRLWEDHFTPDAWHLEDKRLACEFDISGLALQGGQVVETAVFRLYPNPGTFLGPKVFEILGYAGDGAVTLADFGTGDLLAGPFVIDDPLQPIEHDVTDFVQLMIDSDETHAGFIIRHVEWPLPVQPLLWSQAKYELAPYLSAAAMGMSTYSDPAKRPALLAGTQAPSSSTPVSDRAGFDFVGDGVVTGIESENSTGDWFGISIQEHPFDPEEVSFEHKQLAFEFAISGLVPEDVAPAILRFGILPGTFEGPKRFEIHGYAGDGAVTLADFAIDNQIVAPFIIDDPNGNVESDVTAFVQALVNAGEDYAGFVIRHGLPPCPPSCSYEEFASLAAVNTSNGDPATRPELIVTFGTASAPPSPAPVDGLRLAAVPNPFRSTTTLRLDLPHSGQVALDLLDPSGRIVRELASRHFEAGPHTLRLDDLDAGGVPLGSGIYFARFRSGGVSAATKLLLLK